MSRDKDYVPEQNRHHLKIEIEGLDSLLTILFHKTDSKLSQIIQNQIKIMADLTALTAAVAKDIEVDQSAITLLNGLKAALDAAGTDPVKLKELSDQLGSSTQALADAVVANTPAEG